MPIQQGTHVLSRSECVEGCSNRPIAHEGETAFEFDGGLHLLSTDRRNSSQFFYFEDYICALCSQDRHR